ncbi:MAG: FAD-binding protein [Deltaproteobacteria bacterium]|nr:FAD-binding protein [Deltaproteobacteria bacterium]
MPAVSQLWDEETDVVVVGYGGAGAAAAISSHDAGAKVVILEKDEGGGNTQLATRTFLCPINTAAAREHIRALSFGTVEEETLDAFIEWCSRNVEFIRELGGEVEICPPGPTFPKLQGAEAMVRYRVKGTRGEPGGEALWRLLSQNVERRGIKLRRQTAAKKLVRAEDSVVGVAAEMAGKRHTIGARRAVVLSTGGFEYNEWLKRQFLSGYPIYAFGHTGNRGDGIKLAQELGAELWHMKSLAAPMGFKFPEWEAAFIMRMPASGFIIVDQAGKRFCNETGLEHYSMWMEVSRFDSERLRYSRIPSYLIFDEKTRLSGPVTTIGHGRNRAYQWSSDNSTELEKGWIQSGRDAAELAGKLSIESAREFENTLATYRETCRKGRDEDFGRSKETLVELEAPLYGVPLWPCLLNTQGGPKRNSRGEIMDVWGNPIKRLYGAGELGSIWGFLYQSGGNLGECLASGRMAGFHAASEHPLQD